QQPGRTQLDAFDAPSGRQLEGQSKQPAAQHVVSHLTSQRGLARLDLPPRQLAGLGLDTWRLQPCPRPTRPAGPGRKVQSAASRSKRSRAVWFDCGFLDAKVSRPPIAKAYVRMHLQLKSLAARHRSDQGDRWTGPFLVRAGSQWADAVNPEPASGACLKEA